MEVIPEYEKITCLYIYHPIEDKFENMISLCKCQALNYNCLLCVVI